MSSGHIKGDEASASEVLQLLSKHVAIVRRMTRPFKVVRTYDQPWLAGYSWDGKERFIDRHFPSKTLAWTVPFILSHEGFEEAVMHVLGWKYLKAHRYATGWEHLQVKNAGRDVDKYESVLRPYIKADEAEKIKSMPANQNIEPFQQAGSKTLLAAIERAQGY